MKGPGKNCNTIELSGGHSTLKISGELRRHTSIQGKSLKSRAALSTLSSWADKAMATSKTVMYTLIQACGPPPLCTQLINKHDSQEEKDTLAGSHTTHTVINKVPGIFLTTPVSFSNAC